ncbi:MAG TPA: CPBP family intramembrane glutamic endopeptidase [Gemmatimonadales bacterium]|nr:CPBP family intramembrane glutamic endopeptidase [Gemmatimonadales bacterium]
MALALGYWWDAPPFARLEWTWGGVLAGIAATAPLLIALRWGLTTRWEPAARFARLVEERVGPLFAGAGRSELILLALFAGVAEEALFRGVIQGALEARATTGWAIGITALLFGAAHWVTTTYAVLACLIGIYLGVLFHFTGNLLAPITTHALYDLVALLVLARLKPSLAPFVRESGSP